MTETAQRSDMATGLSLLFGAIVVLASIGTAATAYLSYTQGSETMQLLSGVALSVAFIAGGIAVAAIHIWG